VRKPVGVPVCGLSRRSRSAPNPRRSPHRPRLPSQSATIPGRRSPPPAVSAKSCHSCSLLFNNWRRQHKLVDCLPVSPSLSLSVPLPFLAGPLCANGIITRHPCREERVCVLPPSSVESAIGSRLRFFAAPPSLSSCSAQPRRLFHATTGSFLPHCFYRSLFCFYYSCESAFLLNDTSYYRNVF
jgi:hypothetical protein